MGDDAACRQILGLEDNSVKFALEVSPVAPMFGGIATSPLSRG